MSTSILAGSVSLAEYSRREFRAHPEEGTTLEDLLNPAYWAHVSNMFAVNDEIVVIPKDGSFYAVLLVVACSRIHSKVVVIHHVKLAADAKPKKENKDPFVVEFKGPQRKWSVIRTSDKEYVKEGLDSREAAEEWLAANIKDLS